MFMKPSANPGKGRKIEPPKKTSCEYLESKTKLPVTQSVVDRVLLDVAVPVESKPVTLASLYSMAEHGTYVVISKVEELLTVRSVSCYKGEERKVRQFKKSELAGKLVEVMWEDLKLNQVVELTGSKAIPKLVPAVLV